MSRPVLIAVVAAALTACGGDLDGPPTVVPDASVCVECGMIISDLRYATALVVRDERGGEAVLFDDLGDQLIWEREHPEREVLQRWVRDHGTEVWLAGERATYVRAADLRTPMASGLAAFATRAAADALAEELGGEVLALADLYDG